MHRPGACVGPTKIPNKSAISNQQLAVSSPLRPVAVCAFCIFRSRDRIVRQSLIVDAITMGIPDLFICGSVAFDRAFVDVGIVVLSCGHRGHGDSC